MGGVAETITSNVQGVPVVRGDAVNVPRDAAEEDLNTALARLETEVAAAASGGALTQAEIQAAIRALPEANPYSYNQKFSHSTRQVAGPLALPTAPVNYLSAGSTATSLTIPVIAPGTVLPNNVRPMVPFITLWEGVLLASTDGNGTIYLRVTQRFLHFAGLENEFAETRSVIHRLLNFEYKTIPLSAFNSSVTLTQSEIEAEPAATSQPITVELVLEAFSDAALQTPIQRGSLSKALLVSFESPGLQFLQSAPIVGPAGGSSDGGGALAAEFTQDGTRFTGSDNVFISPANVKDVDNTAMGLPYSDTFVLAKHPDESNTAYSVTLKAPTFALDQVVGGLLTIELSITSVFTQGNLPRLTHLQMNWATAAVSFTIPLANVSPTNGEATITVPVPPADYSAIAGVPPDGLMLTLTWAGLQYSAEVQIRSIDNIATGPLHDPVQDIATRIANNKTNIITSQLEDLRNGLSRDAGLLAGLEPRLSPLVTEPNERPDLAGDVYFAQAPAGGTVPNSLAGLTQSTQDTPSFTATGTAIYVVVATGHAHDLLNATQNTTTPLSVASARTDANLSIEDSFTAGGLSYFTYHVTGLASGDVLSVQNPHPQEVAQWAQQIAALQAQVHAIQIQLQTHTVLNLPPATQFWLENELTIEQGSTGHPPTEFNRSFIPPGTTASRAFWLEVFAPVVGRQLSDQLRGLSQTRGRELIYRPLAGDAAEPPGTLANPTPLITALLDGSDRQPLVSRVGAAIYTSQYVAPVPSSARDVQRQAAPPNRIPSDWYTVQGFNRDTLTPVAGEVEFSQNLPTSPTTVTVGVRWAASGHTGPTVTFAVANVGGDSDVRMSGTFAAADGATIDVAILYRAAQRDLEVGFTPRAHPIGYVVDHQAQVHWTERVTTPAQPATSRLVRFGDYVAGTRLVVMLGTAQPRVAGDDQTLTIVSPDAVQDTGWSFNTLFGEDDRGRLELGLAEAGPSALYKPLNTIPLNTVTMTRLYANRDLPFQGLFTSSTSHSTVAVIDSQVEVRDAVGNEIKAGAQLILADTTDPTKRYNVVVTNGELAVTPAADP